MIHSVKIINSRNESIEMILTNPETSEFVIGEGGIEGLGPEKTNINSTDNQIYDGASYDSAVTPIKNIVFHLVFYPNDGNIERVRHKCYTYFPVKELIKIEIHTDERSLYIDGYVESNLPTIFEEREGADISILCMNPYFKVNNEYLSVIKGVDKAFKFPFCNDSFEPVLLFGLIKTNTEQSILYLGENEVGVKMKLTFTGDVQNTIWIQNTYKVGYKDVKQSMKIDMIKVKEKNDNITISDGDYLIIDTNIGSKGVKLFKNGEEINANVGLNINDLTWITFNRGYNNITINNDPLIKGFEIENEMVYKGV